MSVTVSDEEAVESLSYHTLSVDQRRPSVASSGPATRSSFSTSLASEGACDAAMLPVSASSSPYPAHSPSQANVARAPHHVVIVCLLALAVVCSFLFAALGDTSNAVLGQDMSVLLIVVMFAAGVVGYEPSS